jgi:hypothetical protein
MNINLLANPRPDRESFAAFCGKGVPRSNPLVWR